MFVLGGTGEGEFGIKRGNIGVLARFGLFLAGIAMLFETKGKKGNPEIGRAHV